MATNTIPKLTATPFVVSITTGQWSASGSNYYIMIQASNVTTESILVPSYDGNSTIYLNGPIWCVPGNGFFNIFTSALPSGTVTVLVQLIGTLGEAQYQVLSDVYSKSQVNEIITPQNVNLTPVVGITMMQQNSGYLDSGIKYIQVQFQVTTAQAKDAIILFYSTDKLKPTGYANGVILDSNVGTMIPAFISPSGVVIRAALPTGYYVLTQVYR